MLSAGPEPSHPTAEARTQHRVFSVLWVGMNRVLAVPLSATTHPHDVEESPAWPCLIRLPLHAYGFGLPLPCCGAGQPHRECGHLEQVLLKC